MIMYDTTVDFPTYPIMNPAIVAEDSFDAGQTERGTLQESSGLARLTAFRGEDCEISDTALDCATIFVTVPSIAANALRDAIAAWDEFPQPEVYETEAIGEIVVGETADQPSDWMIASHSGISPTFRLISRLTDLFKTPQDVRWPSTKWPVEHAFEDARSFIAKLPLAHIPEPEIRFADDGEINFLWIGEDVHIDLGFYGTGTYSYFGHNGEGQEIQDENVLASEGLAQTIKNMLTA